jgi:GNAT superfamily N-acetyltransferase
MLIRAAAAADASGVARVHVRSWQAGYRRLLPDAYLDALRPEERAAKYRFEEPEAEAPQTLVACEAELICGFATTSPAGDDAVPRAGELCAFYVDPDWWGRGVGRALIAAARERLAAGGFRTAVAWVLAGNVRGERFYRADGWQADGARRTALVWGLSVEEVRYRRGLESGVS